MRECPTCGESGDHFAGTPRQEAEHYGKRALWALHKLRQALSRRGDKAGLPDVASSIINDTEELLELVEDWTVS